MWLDIGRGSQAQSRTGLDISENRAGIVVVPSVELSTASPAPTKQVTIQRRLQINGWSSRSHSHRYAGDQVPVGIEVLAAR